MNSRTGTGNKADGMGSFILGLNSTTVSGNVVTGNKSAPGKYIAGGALAFSKYGNAEIANSTISGNRLDPAGVYAVGGALVADSVEFSNSTVTGNTSFVAVALKYGGGGGGGGALVTSKAARGKSMPALAALRTKFVAARKATAKAAANKLDGPSSMDSTIIGGNIGPYDIECLRGPCTISGSNNLVQRPGLNMTLPPGTIIGQNPQLAPLANNSGSVAGAPGHALTGPNRTHLLFTNSPAVNAGNNFESFSYEQRGEGFPRVIGGVADIGAIEGAIPPPTPGTFGVGGAHPIPALGPWLLALLSAMLGAIGLARRRRPS